MIIPYKNKFTTLNAAPKYLPWHSIPALLRKQLHFSWVKKGRGFLAFSQLFWAQLLLPLDVINIHMLRHENLNHILYVFVFMQVYSYAKPGSQNLSSSH